MRNEKAENSDVACDAYSYIPSILLANIPASLTFPQHHRQNTFIFAQNLIGYYYEYQDVYPSSAPFDGHQRDHRAAGCDFAAVAAGGALSRHCAARHLRVGELSGRECRNGAEERGDAAGGGHQRRGRDDLHDLLGQQRLGQHHHLLRAGRQCRYGRRECAEPRHPGTRAVACRSASDGREY